MDDGQSAGFLIDGKEYPIPGVDSFDMDEAQLLWDYSGLTLEDFAAADPDDPDGEAVEAERQRKLRHPGLMRTLLHVAYQRGNPNVKPPVVKRMVGQVTLLEAVSRIAEGGDAGPPAASESTNEPSESLPSAKDDSSVSSGNGSHTTTDERDVTPAPTGRSW